MFNLFDFQTLKLTYLSEVFKQESKHYKNDKLHTTTDNREAAFLVSAAFDARNFA